MVTGEKYKSGWKHVWLKTNKLQLYFLIYLFFFIKHSDWIMRITQAFTQFRDKYYIRLSSS